MTKMAIPDSTKIYPRSEDKQIVYLKNVITNPNIEVGDFTFYNDFVNNPKDFEKTMFCIITLSTTINLS